MFYSFKLCRRYLRNRSPKKATLSLCQVDVQTKHGQNEKHFNSTRRNIKRRSRAIYYWYNNTRSSPADVKQNKRSRVTTARFKTSATTVWKWCQFWKSSRRCRRQDTTEVSRLPPQNTTFLQLLACLAQHPSAFTSRCRTDKEGRGALEPPPEDFYVFIRSSPADVKQIKHSRVCHRKIHTLATTVGKLCQLGNYPDAADVKIQPKFRDYLLIVQYFCSFSLVSLSIHPCSRRGAERIRQGEGRWSRPLKTALEQSDLTENSSSENRILRPRQKSSWQTPKKRKLSYIYHDVFLLSNYELQNLMFVLNSWHYLKV